MSRAPIDFIFAGFSWPRGVVTLPQGRPVDRKGKRSHWSGYRHAPSPRASGTVGFYMGENVQFELRLTENETGFYCDPSQDQAITGLVARLPRGRGFLAGHTMGEGMWSCLDTRTVWDDERDAARAADDMARGAAETEFEHQERGQEAGRVENSIETDLDEVCKLRAQHSTYCAAPSTIARIDARELMREKVSEIVRRIRENRKRMQNEFRGYL